MAHFSQDLSYFLRGGRRVSSSQDRGMFNNETKSVIPSTRTVHASDEREAGDSTVGRRTTYKRWVGRGIPWVVYTGIYRVEYTQGV